LALLQLIYHKFTSIDPAQSDKEYLGASSGLCTPRPKTLLEEALTSHIIPEIAETSSQRHFA